MERFKIIPTVHLFLIKDEKILLLKRANTGYEDGSYSVPAGHLDGNETASSGMLREAKEEICVIIQEKNIKLVHLMHRKNEREQLDLFILCKNWFGEPKIGEPDKCSELKWFELNKLPSNTIPYIQKAIYNYQKSVIYSEFGW